MWGVDVKNKVKKERKEGERGKDEEKRRKREETGGRTECEKGEQKKKAQYVM